MPRSLLDLLRNRTSERILFYENRSSYNIIQDSKRYTRPVRGLMGMLVAAGVALTALRTCGGPEEDPTAALRPMIGDGQLKLWLPGTTADVTQLSKTQRATRLDAYRQAGGNITGVLTSPDGRTQCAVSFDLGAIDKIFENVPVRRTPAPVAQGDAIVRKVCGEHHRPINILPRSSTTTGRHFGQAGEAVEKPLTMIVGAEHEIDPFRLIAQAARL